MFQKVKIFDGGFGSELNKFNLPIGTNPEELNITNPEIIQQIHKSYVSAGADFLSTNTFGANSLKLKNSKYSLNEIVNSAISNAKAANPKYVMCDIGPLGLLLEPMGTLKFDEAYEKFKEIVLIANDQVDGFILETFTDLYELKAAVLAVKENSDKLLFATMSFDRTGRSLTGTTPEIMTAVLEGLGVDALGVNCSLGPVELRDIVDRVLKVTHTPVIIQPNRGIPKIADGKTIYDLDIETFYSEMKNYVSKGVCIVGGCCGTTPEFINRLSKLKGTSVTKLDNPYLSYVTTSSNYQLIDGVKIIGERLNPTGKKKLKEAIINEDYDYIIKEAILQEKNGAHILDVNMGVVMVDEEKVMVNVIKKVMEFVNLPLQIDSSNPRVIELACRYYNGIPLINSVNGNEETMKNIFPIAKKYGAMVIGLTLDEEGVPKTSEKRISIAKRIIDRASKYGIRKEKIVIDTLVLTAAAEQKLVLETIKALRIINDMGIKTALGVSNVSFGLPNRALLNKTFLTMAMANGLNLPIINPSDEEMMNAIRAFNVLSGYDNDSDTYIAYENGTEEKVNISYDLKYVIEKGLTDCAKEATLKELESNEPMKIINEIIIPSLDSVGKNYESGVIFLPQLLKSSDATKIAFEVLQTKFGCGEAKKGPVMLLTVKGDVHDIGKNIVKVIVESYGYKVIDLGKDVDYEEVVRAYNKHKPKVIGLSALMTTTVVSMKETIRILKEIKGMCPIFVGGAVLSKEIAKDINADYYSKDALEFVRILEELL